MLENGRIYYFVFSLVAEKLDPMAALLVCDEIQIHSAKFLHDSVNCASSWLLSRFALNSPLILNARLPFYFQSRTERSQQNAEIDNIIVVGPQASPLFASANHHDIAEMGVLIVSENRTLQLSTNVRPPLTG